MEQLRQPAHPDITEAMIHDLVHGFYARVRRHPVLGPIFNPVIGEDWDSHLARMCDFWSSVMRMSGRYKGNPMAVHARLTAVRPEHFDDWLALFQETAEEVCGPELAPLFLERARTIAASLKLGLFYRPAAKAAGP
jgi:hemoglobin